MKATIPLLFLFFTTAFAFSQDDSWNGNEAIRLFETAPLSELDQIKISPDGTKIAVFRRRGESTPGTLAIYGADDGLWKYDLADGFFNIITWSADSDQMILAGHVVRYLETGVAIESTISVVDVTSTTEVADLNFLVGFSPRDILWSLDGSSVVVLGNGIIHIFDTTTWQLQSSLSGFEIDPNGASSGAITRMGLRSYLLSENFTGTKSRLFFSDGHSSYSELAQDISLPSIRRILNLGWNESGNALVVGTQAPSQSFVVNIETIEVYEIPNSSQASLIDWLGSDSEILMQRRRDGNFFEFDIETNLQHPRCAGSIGQIAGFWRAPDGFTFAVMDSNYGVHICPANSNEWIKLNGLPYGAIVVDWYPDGQSILVIEPATQRLVLVGPS